MNKVIRVNQKTRTYPNVEKSQSLVTTALSIRLTVLTSLYNINKYKLVIDPRLEVVFILNLNGIIEMHTTTFNLTQHACSLIYQINFKLSKDSRSIGTIVSHGFILFMKYTN